MPLAKLMEDWKTGNPMSNGQKVQSQKQALAIGYSEGYIKGGKKTKKKAKKKSHSPLAKALIRNKC